MGHVIFLYVLYLPGYGLGSRRRLGCAEHRIAESAVQINFKSTMTAWHLSLHYHHSCFSFLFSKIFVFGTKVRTTSSFFIVDFTLGAVPSLVRPCFPQAFDRDLASGTEPRMKLRLFALASPFLPACFYSSV
jgi:hypothetical protein